MTEKDIDHQIAATVKSLFRTLLADLQAGGQVPVMGLLDFPQKPKLVQGKGKGPRTRKQYERTSISLDRVLLDLIEQESATKHEGIGRIIESALWVRYGRPLLSFQVETSTNTINRTDMEGAEQTDCE